MWTFLLGVIFGLLASCRSDQLIVNYRGCSIAGVFMAEGAGRHSLDFGTAAKVCEQLDSVMASEEQVREAYDLQMETCRNGWVQNGSIVILRHRHHEKCAKNMTGFIVHLRAADEFFDVYCYDEEAGLKKNCTKAFPAPSSLPSPDELPQADEQTTDENKDEPEVITPPEGAFLKEEGFPNRTQEMDAPGETATMAAIFHTELTTADSEAINEVSERGGNSSEASNVTLEGLDPAAGSGMLPNSNEEEGSSLVTPFGVPEETQRPTERPDEPMEENIIGKSAPQGPNGKGQVRARDDPEDNSSSNWLVVIGVIVAVAAILLVCAAVAKRKSWCGRQKTLVITSKDASGGNGAAAASGSHSQDTAQEMVTLMNKENIQENGNTEEFTVITLEESPDKEQQP